jgi:hypothetical protein
MPTRFQGQIVWYRASLGRGVVRSGDGAQFFFSAKQAKGLELEAGVLVDFATGAHDGPTEALRLRYTGGVRTVAYEPPPEPKSAKRKKPTRKKTQAARRAKAPAKPKKPKGAMAEGTMVSHPEYGSGHVVAATKTLVSVEFLSGQRRSLKPSSIQDISGPDVPKAPKRKKRAAPKAKAAKTKGKKTVRRKTTKDS